MIHRRYELPVRRVARPRVFLPTQIVRTARELTSRALTVKAISSCITLELAQKHTLQASSSFRRVDRAAVVIQYPEVGRAVRSAQEPAKKWGRGRRSIPSPKAPLSGGARDGQLPEHRVQPHVLP